MPPSNGPPTADDWDSRRDLITRLYRDEDKPLKEIMTLVNVSGFRATSKMYKSRIHKWGLDKKLKEREARAIVHMHTRRRGKTTRMLLRGKSVDINAAKSHLNRKRITIEDVLKTDVDPLPDLVCETPQMSPGPSSPNSELQEARTYSTLQLQGRMEKRRPQHLDSPTLLKTAELLFVDIREFVLGSFRTGSWVSYGPDDSCRPRNARVCERRTGGTFENVYENIHVWSCERSRFLASTPKLIDIFTQICERTWSLQEKDTSMILQYLFQAVALLLKKQPKTKVLEQLAQPCYFHSSSSTDERSTSSALVKICMRITILVHNDVARDYLTRALHALVDSHNEVLGQFHFQTVHAAVILARVMGILDDPAGLTKPLETLHSSLERQQGSPSRRSTLLLIELAAIHARGGRSVAAKTIVQRPLDYREDLGLPVPAWHKKMSSRFSPDPERSPELRRSYSTQDL